MENKQKFVPTKKWDWYDAYPRKSIQKAEAQAMGRNIDKKYLNTLDTWAVRVICVKLIAWTQNRGKRNEVYHPECWRVAVWGHDDFGMEKDGLTYEEAVDLYNGLNSPARVNQNNLRILGFKMA